MKNTGMANPKLGSRRRVQSRLVRTVTNGIGAQNQAYRLSHTGHRDRCRQRRCDRGTEKGGKHSFLVTQHARNCRSGSGGTSLMYVIDRRGCIGRQIAALSGTFRIFLSVRVWIAAI
jgi:hypothetical protein